LNNWTACQGVSSRAPRPSSTVFVVFILTPDGARSCMPPPRPTACVPRRAYRVGRDALRSERKLLDTRIVDDVAVHAGDHARPPALDERREKARELDEVLAGAPDQPDAPVESGPANVTLPNVSFPRRVAEKIDLGRDA
jgi:hypothetical protein